MNANQALEGSTQQGVAEQPTDRTPLNMEEVPEDAFAALIDSENLPPKVEKAEETPVAEPQAPALEATAGELTDRLGKLEQGLTQVAQIIAAQTAANQQVQQQQAQPQPPSEEEAIEAMVKKIEAADPNTTGDNAKRLARVLAATTPPPPQNDSAPYLENRINQLTQAVVNMGNQKIVESFDDRLNRLYRDANVTKPYDQRALRAAIIQEGQARHGGNFAIDHIVPLFEELNTERLNNEQLETTQLVEQTEANLSSAAPVTHSNEAISAAHNIRERLKDPEDRDFKLGTNNFNQIAAKMLATLEGE